MQLNRKPESNYRVNEFRHESVSVIKSTYGTALQSVRPEVVFVKGKGKFTPEEKKTAYREEVEEIEKEFEAIVKRILTEAGCFEKRYLLTHCFSDTAIRHGKPSLLRYELMLKPKKRDVIERVKPLLTDVIDKVNVELIAIMNKYKFKVY